MKITDFIREESILPDLRSQRKDAVIEELSRHLGAVEHLDAEMIETVLQQREALGSTAIAEGIAIPHAKLDSLDRLVGCFGRSRRGVHFGADDGKLTHFFFVLVAPASSTGDHLKALARISRLFQDSRIRKRLMSGGSAPVLYEILASTDDPDRQ